MPQTPSITEQEHEDFRATVRAFLAKEVVPFHDQWERDGQVSREVWRKAGEAGLDGTDAIADLRRRHEAFRAAQDGRPEVTRDAERQ